MAIDSSTNNGNWFHVVGSVASVLATLAGIPKTKIVGVGYSGANLWVTYAKN